MQVQPAITDSRPLVNPEGGSFPWPMQFPEDSFDPVSQASVVPPAAIEDSLGLVARTPGRTSPMIVVSTVAYMKSWAKSRFCKG